MHLTSPDNNFSKATTLAMVLLTWQVCLGHQSDHNKENSINERPNIIILLADDLGYGDVGYMGNQTVKTPHLDEMASQGIHFDRFYAAAAVCSPTRGSCLTGRQAVDRNTQN